MSCTPGWNAVVQEARDAAAQGEVPVQVVNPEPAQPTPALKVEPAHKQLKSYLPGELCEAFRAAGMKHDLYDWQVKQAL